MRVIGGIALFSLGAMTAMAYQKYGQPVIKEMKKDVDNTMKKASKKLENMM